MPCKHSRDAAIRLSPGHPNKKYKRSTSLTQLAAEDPDPLVWFGDLTTSQGHKHCDFPGCCGSFTDDYSTYKFKEGQFPCSHPGCSARFMTRADLNGHEWEHLLDGIPNHLCPYDGCSRVFPTLSRLIYHSREHIAAQPYACPHNLEGCSLAFSYPGSLNRHIRLIHSPDGRAQRKKQVQRLASFLQEAGIPSLQDRVVDLSCLGDPKDTLAVIDLWIVLHGKTLLLEVDEGQHRYGHGMAASDMKRMSKILEAYHLEGNSAPLVWIRYNPEQCSMDGSFQNISKRTREQRLLSILTDPKHEIFARTEPMIIQYMYYDTMMDGNVVVCKNRDYSPIMLPLCATPITL